MEVSNPTAPYISEAVLAKLAREIACNIQPIEDILKRFHIKSELWSDIQELPRFKSMLAAEERAWNDAENLPDRVRLKALAFCEEWMPEAYARAHDPNENLNHKVELMKVVARMAGLDRPPPNEAGAGSGFKVVINMGNEQVTKELTPQVIEVSADD